MANSRKASCTLRKFFRSRRCIIPADGFYEWRESAKSRCGFISGTGSRLD
ncbi:MAG TPA: SOS response-associated peptidase family protein [Candidatus Binatia bacterium]|nr:SOS response-associated peptidase family protein [Candidatus Binatia bacterium]